MHINLWNIEKVAITVRTNHNVVCTIIFYGKKSKNLKNYTTAIFVIKFSKKILS